MAPRHLVNTFTLASLLVLNFGLPQKAFSEIYDCNGTLTNKPCDGGSKVMAEKAYVPLTPEQEEKKRRELLVANLESSRIKLEREHKIAVETYVVQDICREQSLSECQKAIQDKEKEIHDRTLAALAEEKKSEEIVADSDKEEDKNVTAISIVNDYGRRRYRDPHVHPGIPRGGFPRDGIPTGSSIIDDPTGLRRENERNNARREGREGRYDRERDGDGRKGDSDLRDEPLEPSVAPTTTAPSYTVGGGSMGTTPQRRSKN